MTDVKSMSQKDEKLVLTRLLSCTVTIFPYYAPSFLFQSSFTFTFTFTITYLYFAIYLSFHFYLDSHESLFMTQSLRIHILTQPLLTHSLTHLLTYLLIHPSTYSSQAFSLPVLHTGWGASPKVGDTNKYFGMGPSVPHLVSF